MGKSNLYLLLVCCVLGVVYALDEKTKFFSNKEENDWCIAKLTADPEKLQGIIDYACGVINCADIQPGGACFEPNLIPAHANYCLNALYKANGKCDPNIANITPIDPSYGSCKYQ